MNTDLSDELLVECVEMLFVFCLIWRSMLLDRIPAFYLCYKSLFAIIVHRASNTKIESVESLSCAVHKLEKWGDIDDFFVFVLLFSHLTFVFIYLFRLTDNLVKSRKDFTKTAISAVSDLVNMVADVKVDNKLEVRPIFFSF